MASEAPNKPAAPDTYGFLLYAGIGVGAAGAMMLYLLSGKAPQDVSDFKRYSAIGAVAMGVILSYLSSLPKAEAISWVRSGLTALAVALIFRWAVGEPYRIPSSSMEPTLLGDERAFRGDRVWVNKWWYGWKWPFTNTRIFHLHEPQRWDIVVFNAAEPDAQHPVLVKRIVGLPGERINIRDGKILVNGSEVPLAPGMPPVFYTSGGYGMRFGVQTDDEHAVVPPGHYLVLGDNSANSRDGRYFGWLPGENIVGRVASVWWPPASWRDFTGFSTTWWWRGSVGLLLLWIFVRLFIGRSFPAYTSDGRIVEHYWVSFIAYGLRIPFLGRFLFHWRQPGRGDLVLYPISGDGIPDGTLVAARVAGLPGERVAVTGGQVLVDNASLPVDAWPSAAAYANGASSNAQVRVNVGQINLAADEYFLLSDDPGDVEPYDSRVLGAARGAVIQGKLLARWWPLDRIGRV